MGELLAFYRYPEPNGRKYFRDDFANQDTVIEVFDYCQILLAYITKAGWEFLVDYYGYEKLFELNLNSGWINCNSLIEYKAAIEYEINIANMLTHIEGAKIVKLSKKKRYCTVTMKDYERCEIPIFYLAICKHDDGKYYLFSCDEDMNVHDTDVCDTLEDAVNEANLWTDENNGEYEIEWVVDCTV